MTHKKEIIRWAKCPDGTKVWYRHENDHAWQTTSSPVWTDKNNWIYIVDDKYAKLRMEQADGSIIQTDIGNTGVWKDMTDDDEFTGEIFHYRLKPTEPSTYPAYFKEKSSGIVVKFTEDISKRDCFGVVVKSHLSHAQKELGFTWRCWDISGNPHRWEYLPDYREEPKFKIGDWVRLKIFDKTIHKIENLYYDERRKCYSPRLSNFVGNIDCCESFELWEPKNKEWCWFFGGNMNIPVIRQFNKMHRDGYYEVYRPCKDPEMYSKCEPFIGDIPTILKD